MNDRVEIVASGFGGQGVVRLGQIIGESGVKQGLHVTMLKSHGTETRGGYVRSQVVLSKEIIDSPMCETPDFFVALSSAAYRRFKDTVPDYGAIIYDPDLVDQIDLNLKCSQKAAPAKALSLKHFNQVLFTNTIILGVTARLVSILQRDVVLESILNIMPKFHQENRTAFQIGYEYLK